MEKLIRLASTIRNNYDVSSVPEFDNILKQLQTIEDSVEMLESMKTLIRFQDYISFDKSYEENYDYFKEFHDDDIELLCFNTYYLKNQLTDIFELITNDDFEISDIKDLYDESFFKDITTIITHMNQTLEIEKSKNGIIDYTNIKNFIIFANNLDEIVNMSESSKSGLGDNSIKKSMISIGTLMGTSYNNPQFSRFIHKIKVGDSEDFRLTNYKILGERYTTGTPTKVAFFKIPISNENLDKLKEKTGAKNLEYIYYIAGFGNFSDIGVSEPVLYKKLISFAYDSEDYFQKIVNLTTKDFKEETVDKFANIIKDSIMKYQGMSSVEAENEKEHAV